MFICHFPFPFQINCTYMESHFLLYFLHIEKLNKFVVIFCNDIYLIKFDDVENRDLNDKINGTKLVAIGK